MENQEEKRNENTKSEIIPIVDTNPILDDNDYRVTGDDYFTVCLENVIVCGPSLSDGEKVVKDYLKFVVKTNKEKGYDFVRCYNPLGFIMPKDWVDEIFN